MKVDSVRQKLFFTVWWKNLGSVPAPKTFLFRRVVLDGKELQGTENFDNKNVSMFQDDEVSVSGVIGEPDYQRIMGGKTTLEVICDARYLGIVKTDTFSSWSRYVYIPEMKQFAIMDATMK